MKKPQGPVAQDVEYVAPTTLFSILTMLSIILLISTQSLS